MKNSEKMTNRKALTFVLENMENIPADVAEKLEGMIVALDKKQSGARKPTANQMQNSEIKKHILSLMENDVGYQVKEIAKLAGIESFQKCSALVKQLKDDGSVIRSEKKGKAYFTKAEVGE